MFGNSATGRVAMLIAPTMTVRIAITIATIGLRMKKFAMAQRSSASLYGVGFTGSPSFAFSAPTAATRSPGLSPVVGADDRHLIATLLLTDSRLRNEKRSRDVSGWRLNARVLARPQQISGIGKLTHDLNGSGLRVDLPIREDDSAGMRVDTPVGQGQAKRN